MITLIKSNTSPLKINSLKRLENSILKMAGIFFILILNFNELSAQSNRIVCTVQNLPITTFRKIKNILDAPKHQVYTVFLTKNFPLLEGTTNGLTSMVEDELADLGSLEIVQASGTAIIESTTSELSKQKTLTKNTKTKIAPKLNS